MMNKNLTEATEINADDLNNMLDESENIADTENENNIENSAAEENLNVSIFSDLDDQINKVLGLVENLRNDNKILADENKNLRDENFALKELVEELNNEKQQLHGSAQNLKLRLEAVLNHISQQRQQQTQILQQNQNQSQNNVMFNLLCFFHSSIIEQFILFLS